MHVVVRDDDVIGGRREYEKRVVLVVAEGRGWRFSQTCNGGGIDSREEVWSLFILVWGNRFP